MLLRLVRLELFKIARKPRTYIAFGAILAIVLLLQLALYKDGETYLRFALQSLEGSFGITGTIINGYFVCFVILQTLLVHVPLLIALVAGDSIAGEANMGTLRLLFSRPVSRSTVLLGKFIAALLYTLGLLVFMAVAALFGSLLLFGPGDLIILKSDMIVILDSGDVMWRYASAFGFAFLAMSTVAALAFFLSLFAENSIGPIIATMAVVIVCTILTTMDIPMFNALKPWLFTNHMLNWKGFFERPPDGAEIARSAALLAAHIVVFVGATLLIARKKDILS
ncbi:ABC transporter permease [Flaviaesturariibacter amylovorans]|uniref:ABC transporter permease n=1 Tax=Flaviaesturariibacter amylovorans TaxID=1084520 RepID=A0ABP8G5K0_9BACT